MVNKLKEIRSTGAEEGFTLIELMIVVVIIGILAAIAIPIFANQQKSAIVAGVKSDVKNANTNVATALVKSPTAKGIASTQAKAGDDVVITVATGNAVTVKVSDSATTLAVTGDWNTYKITAGNTSVAPTGFSVVYDVQTGKTVTSGD